MVGQRDGSSDGTRALLERTFQLVAAPRAFGQPLRSARVRGLFRSIGEPDLAIVDTVLEADALSRAVLLFLEDPTTVAVETKTAPVGTLDD